MGAGAVIMAVCEMLKALFLFLATPEGQTSLQRARDGSDAFWKDVEKRVVGVTAWFEKLEKLKLEV